MTKSRAAGSPAGKIYRFAYHTATKATGSRFRPHQLRDADAFAELSFVLYDSGYEYGGLLLNLPPSVSDEPETRGQKRVTEIDASHLTPSDLLVLSTRPPINDVDEGVRLKVAESENELERKIFAGLKAYFDVCSRSHVKLSKGMAAELSPDYEDRANIVFTEFADAYYIKHCTHDNIFLKWSKPERPHTTAAFLARVEQLWPGGPGLLAVFGMNGPQTLAWHYLLRTQFPQWVTDFRFVMAEIVTGETVINPSSLSFADEWEVTPLITSPRSRS